MDPSRNRKSGNRSKSKEGWSNPTMIEAIEMKIFQAGWDLAIKKNRNLHPAHLALTPSNAAFTSTHPERG